MSVGGPLVEVTINGRRFSVAADSDPQIMIGGDENSLEMNGDRSGRYIKTVKGWAINDVALVIDDARGDLEALRDIANMSVGVPITGTQASGVIRQGVGQVLGELPQSVQNSTASVSLGGPGDFSRQ